MKKCIAFLLAALLGISTGLVVSMLFQVARVTDNTMLPGFVEGEHMIISCRAYGAEKEPVQGDVVLFSNRIYSSTGEDGVMMKRVIGVSGDLVMITGGKVYVNNKEIEENYVFTQGTSGEMNQIEVPAGQVFVLGDNRAQSTDSRNETVGLVKTDDIMGKVIFKW